MSNIEVIKLCEFGKSVGTRELGAQIRERILPIIKNGDQVLIDFSSISIISSAFADELFGKLFAELGETNFKDHIKVNRFDNDETKKLILLIINKSISFRKNNLSSK
jgi:hypothetical protein